MPSDPGRSAKDNRLFVDAVLRIARTGSPWRDLPAEFGKWFAVFARSGGGRESAYGACLRGAVGRSGFRIRDDRRNDLPGPSTWSRRKRGTHNQAIGRSGGGLTTKIGALVDALGNLVTFTLVPGQRHDVNLVDTSSRIKGI